MILYGWNSYLLKSVSPAELGIINQPNLKIEYRQRYFHLFFIPFIPIGRMWAVRQNGQLYEASPELVNALQHSKPGGMNWIWAWSGPLLGILVWIFVSLSNNLEEKASRKRQEKNQLALTAFFQDKNKTAPLALKLKSMNAIIDSSLSMVKYEEKKIDTAMEALLPLYLEAEMTHSDTLKGYDHNNTYVISQFPNDYSNSRQEIIGKEYQTALEVGTWNGYGDTSHVLAEIRKLDQYKYILLLKEYNRVEPKLAKDVFHSGYSFVQAKLISIETGKELKNFKIMAGNSDKISYMSSSGSSSYGEQESIRSRLKGDLESNVVKEANRYVFGDNL
jgi:hypothetical protein